MAQINLLKQSSNLRNYGNVTARVLVRVLLVVLFAFLAYYAWLFVDLKRTNTKITEMESMVASEKQAVLDIKNRDQLYTRQTQVKSLEGLIAGHIYWSQFFSEVARVTLKAANYKGLTAKSDGTMDLNVVVPSLADLAKYMQVFNLPEFNKNFSNVRVAGFSQVQNNGVTAIEFHVTISFDPGIIQYPTPKK